jgi:hypothetical protein
MEIHEIKEINMSNGDQQFNFTVDKKNLYREESITDIRVASIRRFIPVHIDGTEDPSRSPIFMAQTQLMSPEGPVPLQATLKAVSLEAAIDEFPSAMEKALEKVVEELKKLRDRQAHQPGGDSRIIVP